MERLLTLYNLKNTLEDYKEDYKARAYDLRIKEHTYCSFRIHLGAYRLRTIITEYVDIRKTKLGYIKDKRYSLIYQPSQVNTTREIYYINKLRRIRVHT